MSRDRRSFWVCHLEDYRPWQTHTLGLLGEQENAHAMTLASPMEALS